MSSALHFPSDPASERPGTSRCGVAILYENTAARDRAVLLSHRLAEDCWETVDFGFSWWRFKYLADPDVAVEAAEAAVQADVLIFSVRADSVPPVELHRWLEMWLPQRTTAEGVVVPLLHPMTPEGLSESPWMLLLDDLCRQTGMERLLPSEIKRSLLFPTPARQIEMRANTIGGVIDGILSQSVRPPSPPPHWGLNE